MIELRKKSGGRERGKLKVQLGEEDVLALPLTVLRQRTNRTTLNISLGIELPFCA